MGGYRGGGGWVEGFRVGWSTQRCQKPSNYSIFFENVLKTGEMFNMFNLFGAWPKKNA